MYVKTNKKNMAEVIFNAGDNVLIPQTADDKDNPNVNAVVKEVKEFELIVEVNESFSLPVPKKYCIKL